MNEVEQPAAHLPLFAAARERLAEYRADPRGALLVVTGPAGAGKSTLLGSARPADERIVLACFPGAFPRELLGAIGLALLARNDARLHDAIARDMPYAAQLDTLEEALPAADVTLVLEDVDYAHDGFPAQSRSRRRELGELAARLRDCIARGCRVIVTAEDAALLPEELAGAPRAAIALPELAPDERVALWRACEGAGEPPPFVHPLGLRLAAAAALRSGGAAHADFEALCLHVWCHLPPDARALLSALAHAGGRVTRGFVRALVRDAGMAAQAPDALAAWGLIEGASEADNRMSLNPAVARAVQELVARRAEDSAPNWTLLGNLWTEAGRRSRTVWDLIRGLGMYLAGGNFQAAYELHREVIEQLLSAGALDPAEEILRHILAQAQGRTRAVVLGNLAIVRKNLGDYGAARDLYEEARQHFDALGDRTNVARVLHQLGNTHYLQGDMEAALRHYEQSRAIAADCGDESVGTAARIQIANIHFVRGDMEHAAYHYEQGLADAERLGDRRMRCAVLLQLGHVHFARESLLEADEMLERADGLARELSDGPTRARVLQLRGLTAKNRGDIDRAAAFFRDAIAIAASLRDRALEGATHYHLGQMHADRGDPVPALAHLAAAAHILSDIAAKEARTAWEVIQELAAQLGRERFRQVALQAAVPWVIIEDASGEDDTH
ncbi:MAG TPA: hypothetical protein DCM87_02155 [Planctomycetes bacterium]|nr:hypothetical protein [Planctomycetota bacterium]